MEAIQCDCGRIMYPLIPQCPVCGRATSRAKPYHGPLPKGRSDEDARTDIERAKEET